jgi:hypothetical protein
LSPPEIRDSYAARNIIATLGRHCRISLPLNPGYGCSRDLVPEPAKSTARLFVMIWSKAVALWDRGDSPAAPYMNCQDIAATLCFRTS